MIFWTFLLHCSTEQNYKKKTFNHWQDFQGHNCWTVQYWLTRRSSGCMDRWPNTTPSFFLNFQTYIFTSFSCMNIFLFKRTGSCQFKYRLLKTKSFTFNLPIIINSTMISGFNNIVKERCNLPLTIFSKLYSTTFVG